MKKFFITIGTYINAPVITAFSVVCVAAITVSLVFFFNGENDMEDYMSTSEEIEMSDDSFSSEETSFETSSPESPSDDTTEETTTEETTEETTTKKPVVTKKPEYTTIPLEEISTTNDNSNKDEVMGGDKEYDDEGIYDGDDEVPIPTTTQPTTTKPTTTQPTTTKPATTQPTTTKPTTTQPTTTEAPSTTKEETTTVETDTTEEITSETNTETESTTEETTEETTEPVTIPPSESVIKRPDDFILDVSYGVDVSKWQGKIDWAKAKAAGVDFVMIKLGGRTADTGKIYTDSYFKANIEGAIANDVKVGIYFFSQAITIKEAIEEASYCIALLKDYKIDYPICFDFEQGNSSSNPIRRTYAAMADGSLTKELLTEITCAFCNTVEQAGYDSMIYASRSSWTSQRWDGKFLNDNYRTWLAVWYSTSNYMVPTFGTGNTDGGNTFKSKYYGYIPTFKINNKQREFLMWQYSDSGRIDGINANVDLDMCFYINEEYEGYTCPMKILVTNPVINTTVGTTVNVMDGVTGTNTLLKNKTSTITYTITNSLGATVSLADAIKNTGTYTITYEITDFTWCKRYNYATLNVYKDAASIPTTTEASTTTATTTGAITAVTTVAETTKDSETTTNSDITTAAE